MNKYIKKQESSRLQLSGNKNTLKERKNFVFFCCNGMYTVHCIAIVKGIAGNNFTILLFYYLYYLKGLC